MNEVAELNQSRCVYFHHGETRNQIVGQLIVARDQAQGQCGYRRHTPSIVESLKQGLFRLHELGGSLASELASKVLIHGI